MKKHLSKILADRWPLFVFLIVTIFFLFPVLRVSGIPFKYDWYWPLFNLKEYWHNLFSFGETGIFGIFGKPFNLLMGFPWLIGMSSIVYFKVYLILVHLSSALGMYNFLKKRVENSLLAVIGGMIYAFSPYIFIRTILGYSGALVSYAFVPWALICIFDRDLSKWKNFILSGFLFVTIFFQVQNGLLFLMFIFIKIIVDLASKKYKSIRTVGSFILSGLILYLPWIVIYFFQKHPVATIVSGNSATTLGYIGMLPHSYRNMLMLSDHQITTGYFYPLAQRSIYLVLFIIIYSLVGISLFNKKQRDLILPLFLTSLLVVPLYKGPIGLFGGFYRWFFGHFPLIAVFRETYHFEFIFVLMVCLLFILGADKILTFIRAHGPKISSTGYFAAVIITISCAMAIIYPYFTFNYAGYFSLQHFPQEYYDLHNYLDSNPAMCQKIYYPPGLGFPYFYGDQTPNASNSNTVAISLGVPRLDDGTTYSYLPSSERFFRNELVSQFYETNDSGQFVSLLNEGSINCVIVLTDIGTKYKDASNLGRETDPAIISKWENDDALGLIKSKQGLRFEKQFSQSVYLYKSEIRNNSTFKNSKLEKIGNLAIEQFSNRTIVQLPLTDWATNYVYYKDGWSRGRYDFWRKQLFTELRQDFIYTDKPGSILSGKIMQSGNYDVWTRYLTGGVVGTWDLGLGGSKFQVQKDQGEEKFVWKKLGDVSVQKGDNVKIENVNGENAIADLVLVKSN